MGAIITVSVYNINKLKEIENFLNKYPKIIPVIKPLEYPAHMCIRHIPNKLKDIIRPIIVGYGNNIYREILYNAMLYYILTFYTITINFL